MTDKPPRSDDDWSDDDRRTPEEYDSNVKLGGIEPPLGWAIDRPPPRLRPTRRKC